MDLITLFAILFMIVVATIMVDNYRTTHCRKCGTKMNMYYDEEEDAPVYQCPKCGRSYIIK